MACPYFMPMEKLDGGSWPHPARLPLGGGWRGCCTAPGHENQVPQQEVLESFCNLGYAGGCQWAPRERSWDAVRFSLAAQAESNLQNRDKGIPAPLPVIRLLYACERAHRPVEHGALEFDPQQSEWTRRHNDPRVQKMAECFLESCLLKKARIES